MNLRILLCVVVLLAVLLALPGCDGTDLMGTLASLNGSIGAVGQGMVERGHPDFPTDLVAWYRFGDDLRASIADARNPRSVASVGAMAAHPDGPAAIARARDAAGDMRPLGAAFGVVGAR